MANKAPVRILLMEDDAGLARLSRMRLEQSGYLVDHAPDGEQGLAMYDAGAYDVLLLDHAMPVYDGIEVIRHLASRGPLPPLVMITGSGNEQIAVEAMRLGARDYIVKDTECGYLELLPTVIGRALRQYYAEEHTHLVAKVFESVSEGIIITDRQGEIVSVNEAFTEITGYTLEEVLGKQPVFFKSEQRDANFYQEMWRSLNDTSRWKGELLGRRRNGAIFSGFFTIRAVKDTYGVVVNYVGVLTDITYRKQAEERLRYLATHDPLSGLANRAFFQDALSRAISLVRRKQQNLALMLLDIDHFKTVNDVLGHAVGDMLLKAISERLESYVRDYDLVARLGGDEFTIVLHEYRSRSTVESVAERILNGFRQPFEIEGHKLAIRASIGLAMYPADGNDVATLLRHADVAMYKAKQDGRGMFRWYAGFTDAEDLMRLDLKGDLQVALQEDQLRVYYQPIVNLQDGNLCGVEALLRWEHPGRGIVPPGIFIHIAEETGLITPIGDYVFRTACAQAKAWIDEGLPLSLIGVNVSSVQMHDDAWLDGIKAALSDTGLEAERLSLELTEAAFTPDPCPYVPLLRKVQELGIGVAIDDFGIGHSSLGRLKDLPVNHLKIDGAFIRGVEDNSGQRALLASIIGMAHDLGITAIAEWVETPGQREILRSSGCDLAQGYFFSPPLPADQFHSFVKAGSNNSLFTKILCGSEK